MFEDSSVVECGDLSGIWTANLFIVADESNKKDLEDILRGDDFNLMVSRLSSGKQKGTDEVCFFIIAPKYLFF